jgi:hypothetical protein
LIARFTSSAFKCLGSIINPDMSFVIVYQASGINVNAESTMINAARSGYRPMVYMEICRGLDPGTQIIQVQYFQANVMQSHP